MQRTREENKYKNGQKEPQQDFLKGDLQMANR